MSAAAARDPLAQSSPLDVAALRARFPILAETVKGRPLVYLDSAASSQKPDVVIEAVDAYYRHDNANVHRGVHTLSERATDVFEGARERCRAFVNAGKTSEIVFVRGATEAINLAANSLGELLLTAGDGVVVTEMEHHANIVPWQMLCQRKGARLEVVPMDDRGVLDLEAYRRLLDGRPKIVAVTHVSNVLGTVNPLRRMAEEAHAAGAVFLVDGAQGVPHGSVDVRELDCDFYAFSGHKMYAPTGIGVLYGREELLERMPPWQGGGEMIREVTFERTEYNVLPWKFEAGTPNIAGTAGLSAAIGFMQELGVAAIARHEADLLDHALEQAAARPWIRRFGDAEDKAGVLSFEVDGVHPNDIGMLLDAEGIAVRTGHHCAMPIMQHFSVPATVRASFGVYNSRADVDALFAGLDKIYRLFR